ncbi:hypothetical protein [Arthrobacter sp. ISL-5]|uniref:hypothetical protein n=1 Tax=Arthrobacter sp. ISL-5 TaxID=2819111 RepID=UPI002034F54C|nr:hypothetical protein [Arthrobacter sp. ISL-5]
MSERPGGKPLSLWVATAGSTTYASLDADIDVDVAVIGGGIAGLTAAEHIARTVSGEGLDCGFRRVSNYTYAETDGALGRVRDEAALAARLGLPSVFASDVPLPFPVKGAVRFDGQAHPRGQVPAGPGRSSPW